MSLLIRSILLTLFSVITVAGITYKAILDNYQSIQLQVYDAVIEQLATHAVTDITVHVSGREVTLLGDVKDQAMRSSILKLVKQLAVVDRVVNNMFIPEDYPSSVEKNG